jgi:hypothetical protein
MTKLCGTCGWDWDKSVEENRIALDKRIDALIELIPPEQRVVPWDDLTPEMRRHMRAWMDARKAADEKENA